MTDADPVRDLLGPAADLPAPPSPDDREVEEEPAENLLPGPGRRAGDPQTSPDADRPG